MGLVSRSGHFFKAHCIGDSMERISIRLDGIVTLSALKAGEGNPLIMIPGWSQSSEEWKGSAESLSAVRKVIALDM